MKTIKTANPKFAIFRDNIYKMRTVLGKSQRELSAELNLKNEKRISDIEYGLSIPRSEELIKISEYFGVTIDDILNKQVTINYTF